MDDDNPIDAFWSWWQTVKVEMAASLDTRETFAKWIDPLSERVHAIHPGLARELGLGEKSEHHICLSAEGDWELRVMTERWVSRAPPPDELWEYYPARQPSRKDPKRTLRLEGATFDYDDFRISTDVNEMRRLVNVTVFHPSFTDVPEDLRTTASFLMLDDSLGEDGVERWIGSIHATADADAAAMPRKALLDVVDQVSQLEGSFYLLEAEDEDGMPELALIDFGIKRIDHLLMDNHIEITIHYPTDRADGLYTETVGEDVNAMEEALLEQLGPNAVNIGHETSRGRRVVHLHTASGGPAASIIANWERGYPTWEIETIARADPGWDVLSRW